MGNERNMPSVPKVHFLRYQKNPDGSYSTFILCGYVQRIHEPKVTGQRKKVTCGDCANNLRNLDDYGNVTKPQKRPPSGSQAKIHLGVDGKAMCGVPTAHKFTEDPGEVTCAFCYMERETWKAESGNDDRGLCGVHPQVPADGEGSGIPRIDNHGTIGIATVGGIDRTDVTAGRDS